MVVGTVGNVVVRLQVSRWKDKSKSPALNDAGTIITGPREMRGWRIKEDRRLNRAPMTSGNRRVVPGI